jgi:thymidylate synthase (FAD)
MKRRPKLHLVGQEPTDIFQDLDQLRADLATPAQDTCRLAFQRYKALLARGVPREVARSVLPVATYSHMFA